MRQLNRRELFLLRDAWQNRSINYTIHPTCVGARFEHTHTHTHVCVQLSMAVSNSAEDSVVECRHFCLLPIESDDFTTLTSNCRREHAFGQLISRIFTAVRFIWFHFGTCGIFCFYFVAWLWPLRLIGSNVKVSFTSNRLSGKINRRLVLSLTTFVSISAFSLHFCVASSFVWPLKIQELKNADRVPGIS